ncbi:MAG: Lrp/AsnC family transcriptional regulator [Synergistaceae bacterium]|nr:Lrp/AsnC family transcriptional regulator [Synergistaceae bacterium]
MNRSDNTFMDEINWCILDELQKNAKISYRQLSEKVNLSVSAVIERIRRMEDTGVIEGYRAIVNPKKVGFAFSALLHFSTNYGNPDDVLQRLFAQVPEITSIWSVTGTSDYLMEVNAPSFDFLEELLTQLTKHGKITTSIVLHHSSKKATIQAPRENLGELSC